MDKSTAKEVFEKRDRRPAGYLLLSKGSVFNAVHIKFTGEFNHPSYRAFKRNFLLDGISVILAHEITRAKKKHVTKFSIVGKLSAILALTLPQL